MIQSTAFLLTAIYINICFSKFEEWLRVGKLFIHEWPPKAFICTFCRVPHTGGGCCRENYLYRVGLWQSQRLDTLLGWITDIPCRLSSYHWAVVLRPTSGVLWRQGGIYICQAYNNLKGLNHEKDFLWNRRLHIRLISQSPRERATYASKRAANQIASLCHGPLCPHLNEVSCIDLDGKKKKNCQYLWKLLPWQKAFSTVCHMQLEWNIWRCLVLVVIAGHLKSVTTQPDFPGDHDSGNCCEKSAGVPLLFRTRVSLFEDEIVYCSNINNALLELLLLLFICVISFVLLFKSCHHLLPSFGVRLKTPAAPTDLEIPNVNHLWQWDVALAVFRSVSSSIRTWSCLSEKLICLFSLCHVFEAKGCFLGFFLLLGLLQSDATGLQMAHIVENLPICAVILLALCASWIGRLKKGADKKWLQFSLSGSGPESLNLGGISVGIGPTDILCLLFICHEGTQESRVDTGEQGSPTASRYTEAATFPAKW